MPVGRLISPPLPLPASTRQAGWSRTLEGFRGSRLLLLLAFCLIWAAQQHVNSLVVQWQGEHFGYWLIRSVGAETLFLLVLALCMALPVLLVATLGPAEGWRRWLALGAAVVVACVMAGPLRWAFVVLTYPNGGALTDVAASLLAWGIRYGQIAALATVAAEVQRREASTLQALRGAQLDALALEREMAEARLQVMQAQIEPHFLFNTLATVRRLYQTDGVTGRAMLDNLMRYLEVALPSMRQQRPTLAGELSLVLAYLNVQAVRMGRRLGFEIDVASELHALEVPPMMLLTLVENAIKHGLNPLPEGGFVRLQANLQGEILQIDVADSGQGFAATAGEGTGLANIRARLLAMYGDRASLTLIENQPRGVTSSLRMPVARGRP